MVGVGAVAVGVFAGVDLGHIRVDGALPGGGPHHGGVALQRILPHAGAYVVHLQGDAQLAQHVAGGHGHAVGGVILLARAGDHDLIGVGHVGELAGLLVEVEARGLEVADGGLPGGLVTLLLAHGSIVDVVAVHVHGVGVPVALVGRLGSGPGGVGDGILDDGGAIAVVGVDDGVAVDGEQGHEALAQRLGGVGGGLAAHVHQVGVDAQVAVAAIVHQHGVDGLAGQLAVGVGVPDGLHGVLVDGGCRDVEAAGDDAGHIVAVHGLLHQQGSDLGLALEVVGVGLQGHDAVGIAVEHIGAAAEGLAVLGLHAGQIALGEAELVVVIVVHGGIAVVVQGRHGEGHVVDGGGVVLGHVHGHAVVAGPDDARDVGGAVAGVHAGLVIGAQGGDGQLQAVGAGALGGLGLLHGVIGGHDGIPEIVGGGILGQLEAPVGSAGGYGVLGGVVAVGDAVVADLLGEGRAGLLVVELPELVVLLLGVEVVGHVALALAVGKDLVAAAVHAAAIGFHALDGQGVDGGRAVVGGIGQHIDAKDDIVDGGGLAVGELDVIAHGQVVIHAAVVVLHDFDIAHALVFIAVAVVVHSLAVDAVVDDGAAAVRLQQQGLGQVDDLHVVGSGRKEGAELLAEGGGGVHHGAFSPLLGRFLSHAADGQRASQDQRENERKKLVQVAHVTVSSLKKIIIRIWVRYNTKVYADNPSGAARHLPLHKGGFGLPCVRGAVAKGDRGVVRVMMASAKPRTSPASTAGGCASRRQTAARRRRRR